MVLHKYKKKSLLFVCIMNVTNQLAVTHWARISSFFFSSSIQTVFVYLFFFLLVDLLVSELELFDEDEWSADSYFFILIFKLELALLFLRPFVSVSESLLVALLSEFLVSKVLLLEGAMRWLFFISDEWLRELDRDVSFCNWVEFLVEVRLFVLAIEELLLVDDEDRLRLELLK